MLLKWIEETRKKPKVVRNQYAFFGAVAVTSCIVGVWMLSLPTHFASIDDKYEDRDNDTSGLFSNFIGDMKSQFAASFTSRLGDAEDVSDEKAVATSTKPRLVLDEEEAAALRAEYEAFQRPSQRIILIGTTSKDHINATNTPN